MTYLAEKMPSRETKKSCETLENLHQEGREFIDFWARYMDMDEDRKTFFIQYSMLIVTESGKLSCPHWGMLSTMSKLKNLR